MGSFEFLKEYISEEQQNYKANSNEKRHIFYKVGQNEIVIAEKKIGKNFPDGLKEFYSEI